MTEYNTSDPNRLLLALADRRVQLELGTPDLCFVALLYLRAQDGAAAGFQEEQLVEAFEAVCELVEPNAEQRRKRATHAIQRLRDQRMLARVDGAGFLRSGEYALTRLASGIAEFFLSDDALTRESLSVLTKSLLTSLCEIREAARRADSPEAWHTHVLGPLQVSVSDLASGIERRQRGLDLQQEAVQKKIGELLAADWFGAVARCQNLLEETSATLSELNEVLLRDTHQLQTVLQDIEETAVQSDSAVAQHAAARVMEQLDRIAAWGSARQRAWSEYYQYVHRYLRDVVRLDPSRALTQRLRDQMTRKTGKAFSLTVARAPSIQVLREVMVAPERPPVKRRRSVREAPPDDVAGEDPRAVLEGRVRELLASGVARLTEVTTRVTEEVPEGERFVTAGRVAEVVARAARPRAERERPWLPIQDDIVIEEWQVPGIPEGDDGSR
ncbi:MAG TPA: condensin subunit MukF [Polyangiaceae bacterium]